MMYSILTGEIDVTKYIVTAHKFLDSMAKLLNKIITDIPTLKAKYEEEASEDYQMMDARKLFDVIRVYTANQDDMAILHCLSTILLSMSNRIAHQCYLIDHAPNEDNPVFNISLVGTRGFITTMAYYGDKLATEVMNTFELNTEEVRRTMLYSYWSNYQCHRV